MKIVKYLFQFLTTLLIINGLYAQSKNPTFEEVLSLQSISNPVLSPDGQQVLFEVNFTDWEENKYDREIWLVRIGNDPIPLTNNPDGTSRSPKWSPDGQWIAFLSDRDEKTQIHILNSTGGESIPWTETKQNIQNFEWHPDGGSILFLQSEDKSDENKKRKDKYGSFETDDAEYTLSQLWQINFDPAQLIRYPNPQQMEDSSYTELFKPTRLLDSFDQHITRFKWSPDGQKIAINHQPDPLINTFFKSDIAIYDVESKEMNLLVHNPSYDGFIDWSPDSQSILYESALEDSLSNYYLNDRLFTIHIDGTNRRPIGLDFDENMYGLQWTIQGIYGVAWQRTKRSMIKIDPANGMVSLISSGVERVRGLSISTDGSAIAFTGANDESLTELYWSNLPLSTPRQLTHSTDQIEEWATAQSEVIQWLSKDGASIEGVLMKPQDYDPAKKYPLLVVIHGGPTGISVPNPAPSYVYPMLQWLNNGALILMPNYRGSAGYGERFRSLNVRNLGVGDAWDVLSGVQYLEDQGLIDSEKIGCMGWSQGGYISAFLTTNSDKFKAISVGAGISNWMTYYVNTDIHPFTRQYLKATPWSDQAIYEKTSPMTNINQAKTPTLIQHGEFDRRVPIANAYELVQGLRDQGVPTKLIVYKGFGHGITKPKERLAAVWHNWEWFSKYIWNESVQMPE